MHKNNIRNLSFTEQWKKRGSALMTVLIIGSAMMIVTAYALKWGVLEKKINVRHILRHEAKNAAESVVEYGFADLISRFTRQTSFPVDELSANKNPLKLPASFTGFMEGTNVIAGECELHGGMVPPGEWKFIDPKDPSNEFDPLKGKLAFVREIEVYGKAKTKATRGGG